MKRLLLLTLLCTVATAPGEATNLGCESLSYSHLRFEHWSNYCRRSDLRMLYYSGLMEALNVYVERRQAEGALEKKPFEITFHDPMGSPGPTLVVDQNSNAYQVHSRNPADLNLRHLIHLVEYFTLERWHPFPLFGRQEPEGGLSWLEDRRRAEEFFRALAAEVGEPDPVLFRGRAAVVDEVGELEVVYEDDRISYVLAGEALDLEPADPVPVSVGDRYLLGIQGALVVLEDGVEIARHQASWKDCNEPPRAKVDGDSVKIGCDGSPRQYTYSYAGNRFQEDENARDENYRYQGGCGDEGCGGVRPTPVRVLQHPAPPTPPP